MANPEDTTNKVVRLADFRMTVDPVLNAQRQMRAARNDDEAYELARERFTAARPRTIAGVDVILEHLQATAQLASEGEEFSEEGWAEVIQMIQQARTFTARATARRAG